MSQFPINKLCPCETKFSGVPGDISLEILLEPFKLGDLEVRTSIVLENIDLPTTELAKLSGQIFQFSINPEDGYIDGSIYIHHAHHPVDVTQMSFGLVRQGRLIVRLQMKLVFSFEGLMDYQDTDCQLAVVLREDGD